MLPVGIDVSRRVREKYCVRDFAVSMTSLEQIFQDFAVRHADAEQSVAFQATAKQSKV